jgi:hypothetical protein
MMDLVLGSHWNWDKEIGLIGLGGGCCSTSGRVGLNDVASSSAASVPTVRVSY